ncbi:hypothetical protein GC169_07650 [bacterium]|nr:hypothetical protein [bacterium]
MMKPLLAALALGLAGCMPAAQEESGPAASTDAPAAAAGPAAADAADVPASLAGRWGVTADACSPDNAARDGVIEITATTVAMGLDACTVTRVGPEGDGLHLVVQCQSGEGGEDYERDFSFSTPAPGMLRWITEGGSAEDHVRCP